MNDEDRALIRELIQAIAGLTVAIQNMPQSIKLEAQPRAIEMINGGPPMTVRRSGNWRP